MDGIDLDAFDALLTAATPGPWLYEPPDSGDDSVGIQPSPPYIYADPDEDGNVYPICTIDEPQRRAARDPVDEYDECMEWAGSYTGNAALIVAAVNALPSLIARVRELERDAANDQALLRDVVLYLHSLRERLHPCPLRDGTAKMAELVRLRIAAIDAARAKVQP